MSRSAASSQLPLTWLLLPPQEFYADVGVVPGNDPELLNRAEMLCTPSCQVHALRCDTCSDHASAAAALLSCSGAMADLVRLSDVVGRSKAKMAASSAFGFPVLIASQLPPFLPLFSLRSLFARVLCVCVCACVVKTGGGATCYM